MEYYGINVGAWWIHGITLHTTDTMVYSETLWWSMVDGLNHGSHGAYHSNTVLPSGRAGRPIDGP